MVNNGSINALSLVHWRIVLIFLSVVLLALMSPPFVFSIMDYFSRELRGFIGLVVIFVVGLSVGKVKVTDFTLLMCVFFLFFLEIILAKSRVSNILSYYAVIIVSLLLFMELRGSYFKRALFLDLWVRTAYLLSSMMVVLFIIHQFTELDTDVLGLSTMKEFESRTYKFSLFGATLDKKIGFITLARVCGYFSEPQYAGLYCALNTMIALRLIKPDNYRGYLTISIVAGILTFSITFYLALFLVAYLIFLPKYIRNAVEFLLIMLVIAVVGSLFDLSGLDDSGLLQRTSFSDRLNRIGNSVGILANSSLFEWFLGHGVGYKNDFDRGISSGVFHILVERGLIGLGLLFLMIRHISNKDYVFIIVCAFFLIAMPWYKYYIYWIAVVVFYSTSICHERSVVRYNRAMV
ncbi:MAG: hypothetical protein ABW168_16910 [Sedimenticola sp.]